MATGKDDGIAHRRHDCIGRSEVPAKSQIRRGNPEAVWMTDTLLHEPLMRACQHFADAPAVESREGTMTFAALERHARMAADRIAVVREREATSFMPVVVTGRKNAYSMVGALASLLAGGAYVPIDPLDPPALIHKKIGFLHRFVLITTGMTDSLAIALHSGRLRPCALIDMAGDTCWDASLPAATIEPGDSTIDSAPEATADIAYILFTSGSTGIPRPVCVSHRAAAAANAALAEDFGFHAADRVLGQVSLSFDMSLWDFFAAAPKGSTWVPLPLELDDSPAAIADFIRDMKVTSVSTVPAFFDYLHDHVEAPKQSFASIRRVLLSGETPSEKVVQRLFAWLPPEARVFDLFGATEMPHVLFRQLVPHRSPSTYGFGHVASCVEVDFAEPLYTDDPGVRELLVRGPAVLEGYLIDGGRIASPPQMRCSYRSGDLFRKVGKGELFFIGRCDRQCKISGFRVDLDGIEATLEGTGLVAECVALISGAARMLTLFVGGANGRDSDWLVAELRRICREELPPYAQPGAIRVMARLPRTLSGKKNRRLLQSY